MPESGVKDDNNAGAQMNSKLWMENVFKENCQSVCLGWWGGISSKAGTISLALLGDFLTYSREGSKHEIYVWERVGVAATEVVLCIQFLWKISVAEQCLGKQHIRVFSVGQSCIECSILNMQRSQLSFIFLSYRSVHIWMSWFCAENLSKDFSLD